eukprot:INCI1023.1.p1 GENE.INCI1023.1~~INCI1023.1.p1  ORF type:complete len:237 (-),score=41.34 INCI1023.1:157-867(-)
MRVLSAVGATVVVATLAATASAQTCNFETCMGKTCDYWDYAYSCDTLEDAAECDCAGCACSDADSDGWLTTLPDETTGLFGFIGGGFQNSVTGTFGVATGGYRARAFDNYASVAGGFKHDAFARFSSVAGGARNTARGRFSLATGYKGDAMKDFTAAFGFSGETCATRSPNSMAFCAESIKFNEHELLDLYDRRRADEVAPEDLYAVIAAQRKVIAEQNDRLEVIEDLLLQKGMKL